MPKILLSVFLLSCFFGGVQAQADFSLQVRHDHDPWGQCRGELRFTTNGIEFISKKEKHSRQWKWTDLQGFDRKAEERFSVLTWEDEARLLGADREFDFTTEPSTPLSPELFALVEHNVKGSITDRAPDPVTAEYSVPVKHLHTLGGCQGTLLFSDTAVTFESEDSNHSRSWEHERDISSIWSLHRYSLEIFVFEANRREFSKLKRFRFQLKERLDQEYYEKIRQDYLEPY
jgi:hypothetical protein